ncbi:MAG: L-threonylcarbamoyladenylate synthase [Negativicutes bacterium]|nr:L-threonylcarbamoyladenylate synthase [Negativicutes bacterium]
MAYKLVDRQLIQRAGQLLAAGELVAFPTETVYGLGANGLDRMAVKKIFQAKGRPADNPLILHIARPADLSLVAAEVTPLARRLQEKFWPGPLTVVLPAGGLVPPEVTGGLDTVAVRMPDHPVAREIIAWAGVPVAAPSANISGRPSPTTADMVARDLADHCAIIIDGGRCREGLESTVVDCCGQAPVVLRPGAVTYEMLADVCGQLVTADMAGQRRRHSPGNRYRHYAPAARLLLKTGEQIAADWELAGEGRQHIGLIVTRDTARQLTGRCQAQIVCGRRGDLRQYAAGLYAALRFFDDYPVGEIWAETVEETGLGVAIMNRLRRAAGEGE